jgi:hypothetical protein
MIGAIMGGHARSRPVRTKITSADVREQGACGLLIYCAENRDHSIALKWRPLA